MSFGEIVGSSVGILALITGLLAGFTWLIRAVVRDELGKATKPIQPGYRNGGESLADVANNVKRIMQQMGMNDE